MTTPTPTLNVSVRRLTFTREPGHIIASLETAGEVSDDKIADVFRLALGMYAPTPPTMGAELPPLEKLALDTFNLALMCDGSAMQIAAARRERDKLLTAIATDRLSASRATPALEGTVPWPEVTAYAGGAESGGIAAWQNRALAAEAARDVDETNHVLADNYLKATHPAPASASEPAKIQQGWDVDDLLTKRASASASGASTEMQAPTEGETVELP